MPTLLQINSVINYSSTGRIAEELGQVAIARGWESYVAFGRHERPSKSKLFKIGSDLDIKFHVLRTRLFDSHGLGSSKSTAQLVENIKIIKPDIIHLNNLHGYYLNIQVLFDFLASENIPIIWTLYDCWPFTGHCTYFDFVGCDKWKSECFNCPQSNQYPASYFLDRSTQNYQLKKKLFTSVDNLTIISNSNWLKNLIKQSYLKNYTTQVINSGINTKVFKPVFSKEIKSKYNLEGKFVVLGVANDWIQRKGLNDFIQLSNIIDSKIKIVLLGLNKSQQKSIPKNILGIERTENIKELIELYSCADVFVNPTWEDNFPTTNLEALACGTPVITYRTGGSPEAIDLKTGVVVQKGDIAGLLDAIKRIEFNGKEFYSKECVDRAKRLFNKDDRFQDYISLYQSVLNKN